MSEPRNRRCRRFGGLAPPSERIVRGFPDARPSRDSLQRLPWPVSRCLHSGRACGSRLPGIAYGPLESLPANGPSRCRLRTATDIPNRSQARIPRPRWIGYAQLLVCEYNSSSSGSDEDAQTGTWPRLGSDTGAPRQSVRSKFGSTFALAVLGYASACLAPYPASCRFLLCYDALADSRKAGRFDLGLFPFDLRYLLSRRNPCINFRHVCTRNYEETFCKTGNACQFLCLRDSAYGLCLADGVSLAHLSQP